MIQRAVISVSRFSFIFRYFELHKQPSFTIVSPPIHHAVSFSRQKSSNALCGRLGGKTGTRDVPCFSARLWIASIRWLPTAVWWWNGEQHGVVWRMMMALLDVSGSLDGSVAGCERVLDVSVVGCELCGGGEAVTVWWFDGM